MTTVVTGLRASTTIAIESKHCGSSYSYRGVRMRKRVTAPLFRV